MWFFKSTSQYFAVCQRVRKEDFAIYCPKEKRLLDSRRKRNTKTNKDTRKYILVGKKSFFFVEYTEHNKTDQQRLKIRSKSSEHRS